jgi:hypothetical protein
MVPCKTGYETVARQLAQNLALIPAILAVLLLIGAACSCGVCAGSASRCAPTSSSPTEHLRSWKRRTPSGRHQASTGQQHCWKLTVASLLIPAGHVVYLLLDVAATRHCSPTHATRTSVLTCAFVSVISWPQLPSPADVAATWHCC